MQPPEVRRPQEGEPVPGSYALIKRTLHGNTQLQGLVPGDVAYFVNAGEFLDGSSHLGHTSLLAIMGSEHVLVIIPSMQISEKITQEQANTLKNSNQLARYDTSDQGTFLIALGQDMDDAHMRMLQYEAEHPDA